MVDVVNAGHSWGSCEAQRRPMGKGQREAAGAKQSEWQSRPYNSTLQKGTVGSSTIQKAVAA